MSKDSCDQQSAQSPSCQQQEVQFRFDKIDSKQEESGVLSEVAESPPRTDRQHKVLNTHLVDVNRLKDENNKISPSVKSENTFSFTLLIKKRSSRPVVRLQESRQMSSSVVVNVDVFCV